MFGSPTRTRTDFPSTRYVQAGSVAESCSVPESSGHPARRLAGNEKGLKKLRPFPVFGSPTRTRTRDQVINSHSLYQLSYRGMAKFS